MAAERTTISLEPDVRALVEKSMHQKNQSFKTVINDALRAQLAPREPRPVFRTPSYSMGPPKVDLTKALQLAGELEDAEIIRKMRAGK